MRSTAEENGRNPSIAEGMVDEDLEIPGIKKSGQIVTFSTSEALEHGYCDAKVESITELLKRNNLEDATVSHFELSLTERVIAFALNPFISGILILIIIAGIYFEMQTPGLGTWICRSGGIGSIGFIPGALLSQWPGRQLGNHSFLYWYNSHRF
jgi:membrane-bound serine protease (ClpP class)